MRPLRPSITGYVGCIEETKPLVVTCTTTGSRPKATLQWTIGLNDVTFNATDWFNHVTASDAYTVISDLAYSVGKGDHGQVLTCKAVNMAASSGVQTSITLNVKCKLNRVLFTDKCNMIFELVRTLFLVHVITILLLLIFILTS